MSNRRLSVACLRVVLGSTGRDLMVEEGGDTRALATGLSCLLRAGLVLTHSGTGRSDQVLPCSSAGAQVIRGRPSATAQELEGQDSGDSVRWLGNCNGIVLDQRWCTSAWSSQALRWGVQVPGGHGDCGHPRRGAETRPGLRARRKQDRERERERRKDEVEGPWC